MEILHEAAPRGGSDASGLPGLVTQVRDTLRRRWLTLAIVTAAIFALGVTLVLMMTPQYSATARLRIDPARNPLAAADRNQQEALNPEAIDTEVTVLSSLDMARQVVRKLDLTHNPLFAKVLERTEGPALSGNEREDAVANALLQKLAVGREKLTYILSVRYSAPDALMSARIANAFAKSYIESKTGSRQGTAERQAEWFRQRLDALGREVAAADARVAQYRAQAGIVQGGGLTQGTITDQQIAPLSNQLATAESDAAAARANLSAAQSQVRRGGADEVSQVLDSPVITDLRRQRAEVLRSMGEVQARYGERHPESIRVRDQLAALDAQLREESSRVVNSLRATAAAAQARSDSLRGAMGRLESQQASNTRNAVLADSLEREAAAKRAQYERMSQLSLESTQSAQNQIAQAEIVDAAQVPTRPSWPNKPLLFALSLILGLGAGAGVIFIQEMLVAGMRTSEEVQTRLGLPMIAAVPKVTGFANPADLLLEKPTSLFAESLRNARASIVGVRGQLPHKVIAITSALPAEGKTTTALAFARTLAINNARTLVLECDVRRAAMSEVLGERSKGAGLVELLREEVSLDQAITPSGTERLDQLLVRTPYFSSGDLFGDGAMEDLLGALRDRYDHIVLDLPPIVGLADGRFLAVLADATALCVRWDATPPAAASSALQSLQGDGANVVGVIFTMVDPDAEAIGGLYYSKKYSSYYQAG